MTARRTVVITCDHDGCLAVGPSAPNKTMALQLAANAGWAHLPFSGLDHCPDHRNPSRTTAQAVPAQAQPQEPIPWPG